MAEWKGAGEGEMGEAEVMSEESLRARVESLEEREKGIKLGPEEGESVVVTPTVPEEYGVLPKLVGQTLVLVGNGPSSPENKEFIDRIDMVARVQGFPMGDAGTKWNIWAGCFGLAAISNIKKFKNHKAPNRPRILWCAGDNRRRADKLGITDGAVVSMLPGNVRERVKQAVGCDPTSGFMAIEMALRAEPRELVLVGYDATTKEKPGWDHWKSEQGFPPVQTDKPIIPGTGHNMAAEKALLEHWVKTREFCGQKFPKTRPRWWRMKEVGQLGALAGKRVCMVGNGPSAVQYAREIDECDVVVRINAFPVGEAGHKWDAYFSSFAGVGRAYCEKHGLYNHPTRPDWVWCMEHLQTSQIPYKPSRISRLSTDRINWIGTVTNRTSKIERGINPRNGRPKPISATSGIFAIDLALGMSPAELILVGFDAFKVDEPGWEHYGSKPCAWHPELVSPSGGKHDYVAEKLLVKRWFDTREFYGSFYPHTKPVWWRLKK